MGRCGTCRHWAQGPDLGRTGECMVAEEGPEVSLHTVRYWAADKPGGPYLGPFDFPKEVSPCNWIRGSLETDCDFGCVSHDPRETEE